MKSEWERIVAHFESTAKCHHGNKPKVDYEPGSLLIACDGCKCHFHDGDGLSISQALMEWTQSFGMNRL